MSVPSTPIEIRDALLETLRRQAATTEQGQHLRGQSGNYTHSAEEILDQLLTAGANNLAQIVADWIDQVREAYRDDAIAATTKNLKE